MRIAQTVGELGLEKGVLAAWPEPRSGQALKPRFGSRPFPRKPIYAALSLLAFLAVGALGKGMPISPTAMLGALVGVVVLIGLAWPLMNLLDRMTKRNVWIYPDRVMITHANSRWTIGKADLKKVVVYPVGTSRIAFEFVRQSGRSHVVALAEDIDLDELLIHLGNGGYAVERDV